MKMRIHVCIVLSVIVMPGAAGAMPDREREKDYLPSPGLEWHRKFVYFKGLRVGSWEGEIRWFAREAGMEFVALSPLPEGIACGVHPMEPKLCSLVEVFDIINEILQGSTKHTLIRDGKRLILISADGSIHDQLPFPHVQIRDLPGRGNTEIVQMEATFESEPMAGQVKKLLGEFGHVAPLGGNRYALRGTVQSLKLVFELCKQ
jgi:hypothetical protein